MLNNSVKQLNPLGYSRDNCKFETDRLFYIKEFLNFLVCYRIEQMYKYINFVENQDSHCGKKKIQIQKNKVGVVLLDLKWWY